MHSRSYEAGDLFNDSLLLHVMTRLPPLCLPLQIAFGLLSVTSSDGQFEDKKLHFTSSTPPGFAIFSVLVCVEKIALCTTLAAASSRRFLHSFLLVEPLEVTSDCSQVVSLWRLRSGV